jgi:hypothetical protein
MRAPWEHRGCDPGCGWLGASREMPSRRLAEPLLGRLGAHRQRQRDEPPGEARLSRPADRVPQRLLGASVLSCPSLDLAEQPVADRAQLDGDRTGPRRAHGSNGSRSRPSCQGTIDVVCSRGVTQHRPGAGAAPAHHGSLPLADEFDKSPGLAADHPFHLRAGARRRPVVRRNRGGGAGGLPQGCPNPTMKPGKPGRRLAVVGRHRRAPKVAQPRRRNPPPACS